MQNVHKTCKKRNTHIRLNVLYNAAPFIFDPLLDYPEPYLTSSATVCVLNVPHTQLYTSITCTAKLA